jgi:hypothetical protein
LAGHQRLAGFFWLTQRTIADMAVRYGGHVVTVLAAASRTPSWRWNQRRAAASRLESLFFCSPEVGTGH